MLPIKLSTPLNEACKERLARHLAWCDLLHRDRLAAAAELGTPRTLPQRLRLVAITDRVTLL